MSRAVYGVIPAEYQVLEYIESNGAQYIDTGIKATQNTRIIADHTLLSSGGDASVFGAWNGFASKGFIYVVLSNMTSGWWCYADTTVSISMTATGRHVVEADGNVLKLDGSTIAAATAADFAGSYNMYLCAHNEAGSASNLAAVRIHACQMYDGDTMVRDYVPVFGPEGVGLYDRVQGRFYGNAGSGVFTAGAATGATIEAGSTTRKSKKIYAVMGGLARKVKKGYAVVSGSTRLFFSSGVSVIYTGTHTVEDATMDGEEYVLYTLTGSGILTLDGADGNVRYWMCGGGAGGLVPEYDGTNSKSRGGAGGGGGYVESGLLADGTHIVTIGAGGSKSTTKSLGKAGSDTTIGSLVASGGGSVTDYIQDGGSGGGAGGSIDRNNYMLWGSGAGASTLPFGMESLDYHAAGGGGGGPRNLTGSDKKYVPGCKGGSNGERGAGYTTSSSSPGTFYGRGGEKGGGNGTENSSAAGDATFYGSGGGGGIASGTSSYGASGAGYQGVAYILIPKEAMA